MARQLSPLRPGDLLDRLLARPRTKAEDADGLRADPGVLVEWRGLADGRGADSPGRKGVRTPLGNRPAGERK